MMNNQEKQNKINQEKIIKNNRAFSLIEVLVTVLILGIVSGITLVGYHVINNSNALKCAKQLSAILDKTRIESMGMVKDSVILRIMKEDNGYYAITFRAVKEGDITTEKELDKVKIGSNALAISYKNADGEKEVTNENPIVIRYAKDSGIFQEDISEIIIVGRKTCTIQLVKETGRNYIK